MANYRITIRRPRDHTFEVEADSKVEAIEKAWEADGDFDFADGDDCPEDMRVTDVTVIHFSVIVGNIGTVYDGTSREEALRFYDEYKQLSVTNYGRAAGEPVTLTEDGEPQKTYEGKLHEQN